MRWKYCLPFNADWVRAFSSRKNLQKLWSGNTELVWLFLLHFFLLYLIFSFTQFSLPFHSYTFFFPFPSSKYFPSKLLLLLSFWSSIFSFLPSSKKIHFQTIKTFVRPTEEKLHWMNSEELLIEERKVFILVK